MRNDRLSVLSMAFAVAVFNLAKELKEKREYTVSDQVVRSATSIGANIREAQYAASRADFINKLRIALKEANETEFWLELLLNTSMIEQTDFEPLASQCNELKVLLIKSIKTAEKNQ